MRRACYCKNLHIVDFFSQQLVDITSYVSFAEIDPVTIMESNVEENEACPKEKPITARILSSAVHINSNYATTYQ